MLSGINICLLILKDDFSIYQSNTGVLTRASTYINYLNNKHYNIMLYIFVKKNIMLFIVLFFYINKLSITIFFYCQMTWFIFLQLHMEIWRPIYWLEVDFQAISDDDILLCFLWSQCVMFCNFLS